MLDAYTKAVKASIDLRQHFLGNFPSLGPTAHLGQVQAMNQALTNQTPIMNHVPQLPIVPHPGPPLSQASPIPNYSYNVGQAAFPHQQANILSYL